MCHSFVSLVSQDISINGNLLNIGVKEYGNVSQNKILVGNASFYSECVSSSTLVSGNTELRLFYLITLQLFDF
jgi:hypothetical protein